MGIGILGCSHLTLLETSKLDQINYGQGFLLLPVNGRGSQAWMSTPFIPHCYFQERRFIPPPFKC